MSDIAKLRDDVAVADADTDTLWYDAGLLTIEGKGWADTEGTYERLPAHAKGTVREPVWNLSKHSAGLAVRFATDAQQISARWDGGGTMNHMAATGQSGLDLYVRHGGVWRWLGVGRPQPSRTTHQLVAGLPPGQRDYILYLPLYSEVTRLEIGIPSAASITPAPVRDTGALVFYGTSITQGGCASRPGMAYPAIVGRRLDCPAINLGFSGNGQMDRDIAELLAELDPAAYIIDCLPNLSEPRVSERTEPLVHTIRAARAHTPILLVDNIRYEDAFLLEGRAQRYQASNQAQQAAFDRLQQAGVPDLHYLECDKLLPEDADGCTVDGTHFTDRGFVFVANAMEQALRQILSKGA